ncbi:MAG: hypothetical protein GC162_18910 [Planctomycetes bacterium]|nr:hypothetical protein [Planctomycetota bacterium]
MTISASTKPTANAAPIPSEAAQVITNTAPATTESHTNFDAASLLGPASTPSVQVNLSAIEKELAGNKSVTPNLNVTGAAPIR